MGIREKVILTTVLIGIPAYFLSRIIWPLAPMYGMPMPTEYPSLGILSFFESLLFGFGISFLMFGWNLVKRLPLNSSIIKVSLYLSVVWLLVSWWPHDSLHLSMGGDFRTQIVLEFVFHIPTMLAILVIIYSLLILGIPASQEKWGKLR